MAAFADAFQQTQTAHDNNQALEEPYVAPNPKCEEALFTHKYALSCEYIQPPALAYTPDADAAHVTAC